MVETIVKSMKVPGGKLLEIQLDYDPNECRVVKLYITGDYFAYPPEKIDEAEKSIESRPLALDLLDIVRDKLSYTTLYGVTVDNIVELLRGAIEEAMEKCRQ